MHDWHMIHWRWLDRSALALAKVAWVPTELQVAAVESGDKELLCPYLASSCPAESSIHEHLVLVHHAASSHCGLVDDAKATWLVGWMTGLAVDPIVDSA